MTIRKRLEKTFQNSSSLGPRRGTETHRLKTIEPYFQAVASGRKQFELRKMDRDFRIGDILELCRYDLKRQVYLDGIITARITCVLSEFPGLEPEYCVLGIRVLDLKGAEEAIAR